MPADFPFETGIIRRRIKLFEFENNRVATIGLVNNNIETEVQTRQNIPDDISTPEMIKYNNNVPYYTECLVQGSHIIDIIEDSRYLFSALTQLRSLYKRNITTYPVLKILDIIESRLQTTGLITNSTISEGMRLAERLPLPEEIAVGPIHGDFHQANIVVTEGEVYILDWESVRRDYIINDFFTILRKSYQFFDDSSPFVRTVIGSETEGNLIVDYAQNMGPIAYGDKKVYPGLGILHLLDRLLQRNMSSNITQSHEYQLLRQVIANFED